MTVVSAIVAVVAAVAAVAAVAITAAICVVRLAEHFPCPSLILSIAVDAVWVA
jgi:hypothetical protein